MARRDAVFSFYFDRFCVRGRHPSESNIRTMKSPHRLMIALLVLFACRNCLAQDIQILTNAGGFETRAPKQRVILGHPGDEITACSISDAQSNNPVLSGPAVKIGPVDQWH